MNQTDATYRCRSDISSPSAHIKSPVIAENVTEICSKLVASNFEFKQPMKMKTFQFSEKQSFPHAEMPVSTKFHVNHVTFQRTFKVTYLGYAVLDRRYTLPMLPWVIAEIKRYGAHNAEDIYLEVTESSLKAVSVEDSHLVFEHKLQTISKFAQTAQDPSCFTYMTREIVNGPCAYHVFKAGDESTVLELFTAMREMTKELVNQHCMMTPLSKTASGAAVDSILTSCQHYEVLYLGRIKVSHKRAPPTFIDDAVEKFRIYELEKMRSQSHSSSGRHRHGSGTSVMSLPHTLDLVECAKENELVIQMNSSSSPGSKETLSGKSSSENITTVSKENSYCPDPFLQSPISPLGSAEYLNKSLSPSHSLVSHTQSMDAATVSGLAKDLKGCAINQTLVPPSSLITHTQSLDSTERTNLVQELQEYNIGNCRDRVCSCSGDVPRPSKQTSLPAFRTRVGSGGAMDFQRPRAYTNPNPSSSHQHNRTMLFLIGRLEICLIGTDKKQMLLSKTFNDISHCSQGVKHLDHFGFICRETTLTGADCYAGYVFRCQTEKVVDEMMQSLKQAFHRAHQEYQCQSHQKNSPVPQVVICDGCPMQWFHRLCVDIEGLSVDKTQIIITQRLNALPDSDREEIMLKYQGAQVNTVQEQNEIFMMLLRGLCEQKQMKHNHITNGSHSGKNDFSFLKDKGSSSKLDSFRQKAKKSLSSSFETILKLKGRDDVRERSITCHSDNVIPYTLLETSETGGKDSNQSESPTHREGSYDATESSPTGRISPFIQRPRSSTFSTTQEVRRANKKRSAEQHGKQESSPQTKSPIMNIFMKVGHQNKTPSISGDENDSPSKKGSWRQAIFHRVQTPVQPSKQISGEMICKSEGSGSTSEDEQQINVKKTRAQLRALWKKAILEQILLIRMEKENKKLQVSQDAVSHKRMKLDYEEITPCLKEAILRWDELLNSSSMNMMYVDKTKLQELVRAGVPRHKRGEIWQFLAEQHCSVTGSVIPVSPDIDLSIPYEELLKQLTSHQHAILIDLGRTFPNHPFYAQPLGPGQLSLFNLLKAYSLLDKEVGYCQGLSFVAGILLLHMPEDRAFHMVKHILFHLGLRRQYKPDMVALQIQMYQLSRLMHDTYREVYDHLERYDIAPTLYAAPWFLTLFASQFPLGFVSRLFDLIFLQGMDTIFKVALVLLGNHRELILQCHGFESIMEFLKTSLPSMGIIQMERVFNQVFTLDVSKQLHAYEVEYHVLQEEMLYSPSRGDTELIQKLEAANRTLKVRNMELMEQLQVSQSIIYNLESSESSHKSTIQRLELRIRSLEEEKDALVHSLGIMKKRLQKLEVASIASEPDSPLDGRPPSFGVVYALAGSEKDEDTQFKQLIKQFCEERKMSGETKDETDGAGDVKSERDSEEKEIGGLCFIPNKHRASSLGDLKDQFGKSPHNV